MLAGLAREYAEGLKEEAMEEAGTIWCITPPGVDGYGKRIVFYLGVDDVEGTLAKAESLGGSRIMGPMAVPEGPTIGLFADPEGHMVGVFTPPS